MAPVVTIDARMLTSSGIGTYLEELLAGFVSIDHEFRFKVLCACANATGVRGPRQNASNTEAQRETERDEHNPCTHRSFSVAEFSPERFQFIRATAPIYSLGEQWQVARLARGADLLHCPHYNVPYFYRGRMVATIHDLTHLVDRDFVPNRLAYYYARIMLRAAAHHAHQVITVSEFSKRSICQALEVPENKVHVISYGVPRRILKDGPVNMALVEKLEVSQPYILFVGLLKPHKNVQALLRAFALLPEQVRASHHLVIAGKLDTCYPALRQLSQELRLSDQVVFTGYVKDDELRALYEGAKVFVLPSLNEGYGLPVLEAMAYGVPVVVSNMSSLPEVAGDAGILVDPRDHQSIAKALESLLGDAEVRETLGERGRKRAHSFSAREFALKHLEVYRMALAG
jgi:glycosyltransferase involved in cell wall biosynthesis